VSFSVEWGLASFFVSYFVTYLVTYFVIYLDHMVQEGSFAGKSVAKHDILL
jgi:hypothetical protein